MIYHRSLFFCVAATLLLTSLSVFGDEGDLVTFKEACSTPSDDGRFGAYVTQPLSRDVALYFESTYITRSSKAPQARYCRFATLPTADKGMQNGDATRYCLMEWQTRKDADAKTNQSAMTLMCPSHLPVASDSKDKRPLIQGTHDESRDAPVLFCYALCNDIAVENYSQTIRDLKTTREEQLRNANVLAGKVDSLQMQIDELQRGVSELKQQMLARPKPASR
jgi:hypothetical protein